MRYKSYWKQIFIQFFCSKWALCFVIDYAWISKLLRDAAFTWRPRWLKSDLFRDLFCGNLAISTLSIIVSGKVLFQCFWVPREINLRFCSKTQWQISGSQGSRDCTMAASLHSKNTGIIVRLKLTVLSSMTVKSTNYIHRKMMMMMIMMMMMMMMAFSSKQWVLKLNKLVTSFTISNH